MPPAGVIERFQTNAHTYTLQNQRNGQKVYRKDGKFTSARSYRAAFFHRVSSEPVGTVGVASRDDIASRPLAEVADRPDIRSPWRAGSAAPQIDPSIQEGQILSGEEAKRLRLIRTEGRKFFEFSVQKDNIDLSAEELKDKFAAWKVAISKAETGEEKREVMREFGWDETPEGKGGN